ncbi:hypothetical protein [Candidatus Enterovibrio escicola]|uniref:Glycoside hydrolase 123 C-terminal domain-containing protein n=1 Tax=Candidatus Enterovibrio escicola TaxID=1927127 RepID=A0A2A5T2T0_9GAMM|nr:hypothetical protein [Candidatus Enterovibrio escacola]PCS22456.1 hypothetical protein BTN49_1982 [Candidatus Enterovibrio escacola]
MRILLIQVKKGINNVFFLLFTLLLIICTPAVSKILLEESKLNSVSETTLLLIKGTNLSDANITLVIRADDTQNPSYADRANLERVIPFGEFELHISFASLRTPNGRQLNLSTLQQIILFPSEPRQGFSIISANIVIPKPIGENIYAWDLGPVDSAIWPGFKPLTVHTGMLTGKMLDSIDRSTRMQLSDSLTIDGIRGIDTVELPLPVGKWQITLWLRDAGEWEYLPHPLQREIYANGRRVYVQNRSPMEWIEHVYLGRRDIQVSPESNSWEHFGKRIDDRITFNVVSDGKPVILRLRGDSIDAQFVSAILAVPSTNPMILDMLTRQRKVWWKRNWPVEDWRQSSTGQPSLKATASMLYAVPGISVIAEFLFQQGNILGAPFIMVKKPKKNGITIPTTVHWSQWHLIRTHLSSTLLEVKDTYLRHGLMPENTDLAMPRQLMVRVDVPQGIPAGKYQGELHIMMQGKSLSAPFSVKIIPVTLPDLTKPVGIYLEKPVYFGWFETLSSFGEQAMICDLKYLRKLGLTGISPPYPTPHNDELNEEFETLSILLNKMGFYAPLAYAPAKRLSQILGSSNAANVIARLEMQHKQRLHNSPYWSIADEPSNPGNVDLFKEMYRNFSLLAPSAKLAGHLNHEEDKKYLPMFDMILINDGFGADKKEIQDAQQDDRKVWLYNLPNPRAAAGFYLWKSGADGFLKWHGRMPTADPFDPTDGREIDVQFLYPSKYPCPKEPDINIVLYEMMEGIIDHRWLLWLVNQAQYDSTAKSLLNQLRREIPDEWQVMKNVGKYQLSTWRQQIINLTQ